MNALDTQNPLFLELEENKPIWWNNLLSNKDIYVDIRKDNYIDIYYNGGNIINGLRYNNFRFTGSIHYKYLLPDKAKYIDYDFSTSLVGVMQNGIDLAVVNNFEANYLKRIKANILSHYPVTSEKGIQAKFVTNGACFLDSEFAYNYYDAKLRIDLVWIDTSNKKIVFVELKTMGDRRLYTNDIFDQLKKYYDFSMTFEKEILSYYTKVFEIKKKLQLLPKGLNALDSLDGYTLEKKPLLLFGDCEQKWINNEAEDINAKIKEVAIGAYYFGGTAYSCDIISKSNRNRHIFA